MKKIIATFTVALGLCAYAAIPAGAQTAAFTFTPATGSVTPGSNLNFEIDLTFSSGGNINNLNGLSYWFTTQNPNPPFYFSITNRDASGSLFNDLQTPAITYPQNLNPVNANDLGALSAEGNPNGTYFIANLTLSISGSATPGSYVIQNNTTGGKTSVINDSDGDTFAIPASTFTINVVPEPSTVALLSVAVAGLGAMAYRRRRSVSR